MNTQTISVFEMILEALCGWLSTADTSRLPSKPPSSCFYLMISLNYTQSEQLNGKMVFQLPQFIHRALLLQAPLYIELITQ